VSTEARREVGRIGRAHGVRGFVYVILLTDRVQRVAPGAQLFAGDRPLTVVESRPQQQRWLIRFEGIDDRDAAEALTNSILFADRLDEDDDALWVHDLIGSQVIDQHGIDRGLCVAVIGNPAHDLLELQSGALVPVTFVSECGEGIIAVVVPDGLFDL
jgi:16S rRNA processing protein RimM